MTKPKILKTEPDGVLQPLSKHSFILLNSEFMMFMFVLVVRILRKEKNANLLPTPIFPVGMTSVSRLFASLIEKYTDTVSSGDTAWGHRPRFDSTLGLGSAILDGLYEPLLYFTAAASAIRLHLHLACV